jgi:antitoxin VapB
MRKLVKLFRDGGTQAIRIPSGFELPGEEAVMRKLGDRLIIEPAARKSLLSTLAALSSLSDDFAPIRDLPADPIDI